MNTLSKSEREVIDAVNRGYSLPMKKYTSKKPRTPRRYFRHDRAIKRLKEIGFLYSSEDQILKVAQPMPFDIYSLCTECLVASPGTLRSLAKSLRDRGQSYVIVRVKWKNFNRSWKGFRGLALRVSREAHQSLFAKS